MTYSGHWERRTDPVTTGGNSDQRTAAVTYPPDGPYGYGYSEPTPWAAGITVVVMVAALAACGVYSFGAALAEVHPILAVVVNLIAVGGATPTAWRWRFAPVTRWVIAGLATGVLLGWLALIAVGILG